jgi:hypothetical protein
MFRYVVLHELGPNEIDDETVAIPLGLLGPWKPAKFSREDGQDVEGARLVLRTEAADDMFTMSPSRVVNVRESFSEVCDLVEKARA